MPQPYAPDRELRAWIAAQLLPGETCSLSCLGDAAYEAVARIGPEEARASGETPRRAVKDAHGALLRRVSPEVRAAAVAAGWGEVARG